MDQQQTPTPPPQSWQTPPQQPPAAWGQQGYVAPPPRPMGVTLTGVFYIVVGVLGVLAGLVAFAGGSIFAGIADEQGLSAAFGGVFFVFGIFILIIAILFLASGIGVFGARPWARVLGIVLGVIGAILYGLGALGALGTLDEPGGGIGSLLFTVLLLLAFIGAVWALAKAGPYFAYRR